MRNDEWARAIQKTDAEYYLWRPADWMSGRVDEVLTRKPKEEGIGMTDKRDGGPAFPRSKHSEIEEGETIGYSHGMTLRQWYAGMAMSGPLMDQGENPEKVARYAFQYADAMIAHELKGSE